jgi:CYTH domain-containing protein
VHPGAAHPGAKYPRVERERRFLLAGPPDRGLVTRTQRITDRYVDGTRLRLRAVDPADGSRILKLTQKIPSEGADDARRGIQGLITTTLLGESEYRLLAALPGAVLTKTRYSVPPFGVDVFGGDLTGLVLAEAEFESDDECVSFVPPLDGRVRIIAEVTGDVRFTGGRLAIASVEELATWLDGYGLSPR